MNSEYRHSAEAEITISYDVTPDDCRTADRYFRRRLMRKIVPSSVWAFYYSVLVFSSFLAIMFLVGTEVQITGIESGLFHASLIILTIILILYVWWRRYVSSRYDLAITAPGGVRCGRVDMSLQKGRMRRNTAFGESWIPLEVLRETVLIEGLLLVYMDEVAFFIIPRRAFDSPEEEQKFIACLRGQQPLNDSPQALNQAFEQNTTQAYIPACDVSSTADASGTPVFDGKRTPRTFGRLVYELIVNIRCGTSFALFRKKGLERLTPSPGGLTALVLFYLVMHVFLDIVVNGISADTGLNPFLRTTFNVPFMLLAGVLIARTARQDNLLLALPTAFIAVAVPIDLIAALFRLLTDNLWSGLNDYLPDSGAFWYFFFWWASAALVVTMRMSETGRARRFGIAMIQILLIVIPLSFTGRIDQLRDSDNETDTARSTAMQSEKAFYTQPVLLHKALSGLLPGRKGVVDLYFVGFAAYASEDVFMKEMEVIPRLFMDRFDTAGRSVVMVNNPKTVLKYPVATSTSLERSLRRVGEVMNRDEDILFLYLTSHGSSEHRLSVDLWPLELKEVDPAMLKRMLDKSGIRWRVIAVSACYSGGFIDPLKDDHTLIMTASDARNNSFGCGSESDFTWFGKALFDEELRHTRSFTDAFRKAAVSIAQRELKENETPSNPQIYVGSAIRTRLPRLEERLNTQDRHAGKAPDRPGAATRK